MELSVYQLLGSPNMPTFCQLAPPSIELWSTRPSQENSLSHQMFRLMTGVERPVKSKNGPVRKDCSPLG